MSQETLQTPAPAVAAAILMLGREQLPRGEQAPDSVAGILSVTGAGRTQAYEMLDRLREVVLELVGKPGRPPSPPGDDKAAAAVTSAAYRFLLEHPGAVCGVAERRTYSDDFRRFVVGMTAPGGPAEGMSVAELAGVTALPLGTLKDWLYPAEAETRPESPAVEDDASLAAESPVLRSVRDAHLRLILTLWAAWRGSFLAFCRMLRQEHRMPYGATFIGNFLQAAGVRLRRPRTPVEAPWSSDTFRTLFPGAQWLGDGTSLAVRWGGEIFVFTVEALLDVATNAHVGFEVADAEDEAALRRAYEAALETTGAAPLAMSLDNKASNHTPGVQAAAPGVIVLRSTLGRGQAKAPLEGAFGLFQQAMPPLAVSGGTPREMARSFLRLILTAWTRGRNGRPRQRLNGKSPAEVYANVRPTEEEVRRALQWFAELKRQQDRRRSTHAARRDPVRLGLLKQALAELGISDPEQRLAVALAGYATEAIMRGLATFRAKQELGTLPPDADPGRYLGGIIRQLNTRLEQERVSIHLLEQRVRFRDLTLAGLSRKAQQVRSDVPLPERPQAFVDLALEAAPAVDARFWRQAAAEALTALPSDQKEPLCRSLCRRIAASFRTDRERREDLIAALTQATGPP